MPPPKMNWDYEFRPSASYLHAVCLACSNESGVDMKIEYLGLDPAVPQIKITCETCGKQHVLKLWNAISTGTWPERPHSREQSSC